MGSKILVTALAGGAAMFMWGFVSHQVLPLGEAGISTLTHQEEILPSISNRVSKPGMYMFPWPENPPGTPAPQNEETMKQANVMHETMPHGLLIFHPPTGAFSMTPHLITEFATNVVSSLVAAVLVCMTLGSLDSFVKRVLFVTAIGLSAGIAVNVPYWNWYEFPTSFTLAQIFDHVVGIAVVGAVIAAIIRPAAAVGAVLASGAIGGAKPPA
jgi:hypothetical protein